ncbi:hypothetical protein BURPS406E_D0938 [Burkholderia pseudomallei 406e]|nr:hypothetical protein BURPS406E_D0938 [Burkholderia pseudomallei 406e]
MRRRGGHSRIRLAHAVCKGGGARRRRSSGRARARSGGRGRSAGRRCVGRRCVGRRSVRRRCIRRRCVGYVRVGRGRVLRRLGWRRLRWCRPRLRFRWAVRFERLDGPSDLFPQLADPLGRQVCRSGMAGVARIFLQRSQRGVRGHFDRHRRAAGEVPVRIGRQIDGVSDDRVHVVDYVLGYTRVVLKLRGQPIERFQQTGLGRRARARVAVDRCERRGRGRCAANAAGRRRRGRDVRAAARHRRWHGNVCAAARHRWRHGNVGAARRFGGIGLGVHRQAEGKGCKRPAERGGNGAGLGRVGRVAGGSFGVHIDWQ